MKLFYTSFFLFFFLLGQAQPEQKSFIETNNAKESLMYAQQFINNGAFNKAAKQLKHTIKIKEDFAIAWREYGRVLLELAQYEDAIEAYRKSFFLDNKLSRAAYFECGEAYFKISDTEQAKEFYTKYMDMKGKRYLNANKEHGMEYSYDLLLKQREDNLAFIEKLDTTSLHVIPKNIGNIINSPYDDYLPTITSDGLQFVFTRTVNGKNENVLTSQKKDGEWQKAKAFSSVNSSANEGMAKFETHGKGLYFAGCSREDTKGGCDIYKAELESGEISNVYRLEGFVNSEYWDSQPSITCDGKVMFFTSTREGGYGGADIWKSILKPNGDWSIATNLGPSINTAGDEEAPFISSDGKTIYFSSTGHDGMGEGDLFISRWIGQSWNKPQNLGFPINSPAKELGFYVQGNGKTAYFSSRRKGGEGGLDIYKIELPEHLRPNATVHIEGYVRDAVSKEPLSNVNVLIGREDLKWPIQTDENGWFFHCLPGNQGYSFMVTHKGYDYFINAQFLESQDNVAPIIFDIDLQPKQQIEAQLVKRSVTTKEKRIQFFFGFDSFELTKDTQKELTALVQLLQKEEDWKVEVVGYTDNVGDSKYNMILSEKRAKTIVDFLHKSGIKIQNVIRNEGRGIEEDNTKSRNNKSRRVDVILRK